MRPMSSIGYRPDIDGLRAVAVLSVILFHAGVPGMTGGFVGVDVFFVISGFLITSLILKDLKDGTFSFAAFWERRARRILPALATVIFATLIAGWFLFLPDDYAALGKQVASQAVFGSNILFYKEAGYFDVANILKPLLHTWSLSIEEQFYLLYPLAVFIVWKNAKRHLSVFLGISAIASFALCLMVMGHNPKLAFYMLPFRGWELLAGAIVAVLLQKQANVHKDICEVVSLVGLGSIILPVYLYTEHTAFPGWAAIPPCIGTAAIIWANAHAQTATRQLLSFRPMVFTGLVSYSWYLWHWPVIVFASYTPVLQFDTTMKYVCIGGSFVAAILTWQFVETPFRQKRIMPQRKSLLAAGGALLVSLGIGGAIIIFTGGVPARLDPATVTLASGIADQNPHRKQCDKTPIADINADKVCQTNVAAGEPTFILWGDSQADAIAPAFFDLSERYGRNGFILTHHGCEAILDFHKTSWQPDHTCNQFNTAVYDLIRRHNIKHVFLVSHYGSWMNQNTLDPHEVTLDHAAPEGYKNMLAAGLALTLDRLKKEDRKIYFLEDVPSVPFDPPRMLAMDRMYDDGTENKGGLSRESYILSKKVQLDLFFERYGKEDLTILDPLEILCPGTVCIVAEGNNSLYYNRGHLSVHGALYLAPLFEPYFKN